MLENLNIKLYIIGDGPEKNNLLNKIKELKIEDKVIFMGEQKHINDILKRADLFIFTSRSESLPNSLVEAMANKLPIVAYNVGGISEIIENGFNGYLIDFGKQNEFINNYLQWFSKLHSCFGRRLKNNAVRCL